MSKGRVIVQCDWNQVYREGDGKFWICYKCLGEASVYSNILCSRDVDGQVRLHPEDDSFKVTYHSQNKLKISYVSEHSQSLSVTFRSASREFTPHGKIKKVTCLDVTNGGLGLSCAENSTTLKIWETSNGTVRRELSGHVGDIFTAKFFPSGLVVLSAGADTQLKVWSAETGACAATISGHKAGVLEVDFVERGRNVVSCSRDGTAKLWDVSQQQCIHTYSTSSGLGVINSFSLHDTQAIDLGPTSGCSNEEVGTEGKILLLALESGKLQAFGLNTKQQLFEVSPTQVGAINCVKFVTGNSFVFGSENGVVGVYDLRNLSEPLKLDQECRSSIKCVKPFGQGFFYATADGSSVYVDETLSLSYEHTGADCDPVYQVAHSNNDVYTSCRDGAIRVYPL